MKTGLDTVRTAQRQEKERNRKQNILLKSIKEQETRTTLMAVQSKPSGIVEQGRDG
jgi:hypothetical protein